MLKSSNAPCCKGRRRTAAAVAHRTGWDSRAPEQKEKHPSRNGVPYVRWPMEVSKPARAKRTRRGEDLIRRPLAQATNCCREGSRRPGAAGHV
jgi:hypothetical protein